jgi:hypothetical protein
VGDGLASVRQGRAKKVNLYAGSNGPLTLPAGGWGRSGIAKSGTSDVSDGRRVNNSAIRCHAAATGTSTTATTTTVHQLLYCYCCLLATRATTGLQFCHFNDDYRVLIR